MKTYPVGVAILLGLLNFSFPNQGRSQVLETAEQHLKQAESYQELAEWQQQDIAVYKREREASLKQYDELIREDEALLADFKILEDWHGTRAKELERIQSTEGTLPAGRQGFAFDHSAYAKVLREDTAHGRVDYVKLKRESQDLEEYVKSLEGLSRENYEEMGRDEKIAFWINAYNASVVQLVIGHYPLRKRFGWKAPAYPETSIQQIPGVWDRKVLKIFGQRLSLNQIEHKILRKEFNEPRVHFALVCASRGCPVLRSEPYEGGKLDTQLGEQVRDFLADPEKARYDEAADTLSLSPLFKWFREDFEKSGGVISFVKIYLPEDTAEKISGRTRLEWLDYDWSLNERRNS